MVVFGPQAVGLSGAAVAGPAHQLGGELLAVARAQRWLAPAAGHHEALPHEHREHLHRLPHRLRRLLRLVPRASGEL